MIKFVVCIWNGENYIEKCIESIQSQKDSDFEVYIIDDLSNDRTVEIVKNKIQNDRRFKLIINEEKKFKLKNLDDLISTFDDEDIVIELDGDDYLATTNVVWDIRSIYKNEKVWLTNGSFIYSNGRYGFSKRGNPNTIRKDDFSFSHLRTWKSFLWKSIPKDYFIDENGEYFKSAADVAYCIAMLELSGNENYRFIPNIYYVYNGDSPYNDHKSGSATGKGYGEQARCAFLIRQKPKLDKLIR
jgi:glycosyltransferase involved in cell wall biosynthesis